MDRPALARPLLVVLALAASGSLAWGGAHALTRSDDLMRRAQECALFVRGLDPYDDPDMSYPPTALPVFAPLVAPFGPVALRLIWFGLNLAALAIVVATMLRLWGSEWPTWLRWAFVLVVEASKPARLGIGLGQFHLIPLATMLLAVLASRRGRPMAAGVLVAVALAKPTMSLPFLGFLAARRQWKALACAGALQGVALLGVSAWLRIAPWDLIREWLAVARLQGDAGEIDLPSLLRRGWPGAPLSATAMALGLVALAFAASLACRRKSDLALFSFVAFMASISTYHRPYDLVLLFPALALSIDQAARDTGHWANLKRFSAVVFAALLIMPNHPAVLGRAEMLYGGLFVLLCYGFLALCLYYLAHDRETAPVPSA